MLIELTRNWTNKDIFIYLNISIIILFIIHTLQIKLQHVIGLVISLLIILYISEEQQNSVIDFNKEMEIKLKGLMEHEDRTTPSFFHVDSELIFLFDMVNTDFRLFNRHAYVTSINCANNILRIRSQLEQELCDGNDYIIKNKNDLRPWEEGRFINNNSKDPVKKKYCKKSLNVEQLEIAEKYYKLTLNHLHSFILNIPSNPVFHDKHEYIMERAQLLLKRNLDKIKFICDKQLTDSQVTHRTKFITDYDLPKASNKVIPDTAESFAYY